MYVFFLRCNIDFGKIKYRITLAKLRFSSHSVTTISTKLETHIELWSFKNKILMNNVGFKTDAVKKLKKKLRATHF